MEEDGLLMQKWIPLPEPTLNTWMAKTQIVVPANLRSQILKLAHDTPLAGHLGIWKTLAQVLKHFYWPKIQKDVTMYCRHCHICQYIGKPNLPIPKAPLHPIPALDEPFQKVLIDCVGPLTLPRIEVSTCSP